MSNLTLIKPKINTIQATKDMLELKFTLKSFAFLEEEFGSVVEAVKLFNANDLTAIKQMLKAGLMSMNTKCDPENIEINDELISTVANAISDSISQDYNFTEEIDWSLLYYIIKPAVNMSENEFWHSTHKQMLGFWATLEKYRKEVEVQTNQEQTIKELMSW